MTEQETEERLVRLETKCAQLKEQCIWADGEIARLRVVVRKYEEAALEPASDVLFSQDNIKCEFTLDWDPDTLTSALFVMRGERSVILEVETIANEDRYIDGYENSIMYNVAVPSLERFRSGYRGESANDTIDYMVTNATVEELIVALRWLVGEGEMSPKARSVIPDGTKEVT